MDTGALLAKTASVTGSELGATGTVNTSAFEAVYTGTGVATDTFTALAGGISINGHAVDITDAPTTLEGLAHDINSKTPALSGSGVVASVVTTNGIKSLQLTNTTAGGGIRIADSADAETAGLTVTGQSGPSTATATGLAISINGSAQTIYWSGTTSATDSQATVKTYLNAALNNAFGTNANNYTYANFDANGALTISDPTNSQVGAGISIATGAVATALGLTEAGQVGPTVGTHTAGQTLSVTVHGANGGSAQTIDFADDLNAVVGVNESQANVLSFLNGVHGLQGAVASFVNNALVITSTEKAAASSVSVATGTAGQTLGLTTAGQVGASSATGAAAQALTITIHGGNGGSAQTIDFTNDNNAVVGVNESQANILTFLNGANGLKGATATFVNNALVITSAEKAATSNISIATGTAGQTLGLTTSSQAVPTVAAGAAAKTLSVNIDGLGSKTIDFSNDTNVNTNGTETLAQVAQFINTTLNASSTGYNTTGINYATATATGTLALAGQLTGNLGSVAPGSVSVANGTAAQTLALTTVGSANPTVVYGQDESVANVVAYLNSSAQKALGTSTAANIFTVNSGGAISIASQTKGVGSSFALDANVAISNALGLATVSTQTTGQGPSLSSIASTLTQAFRANTTLNQAGLQASASGSGLAITSSNSTSFRLAEFDTAGGTNLGFTENTGPFSAALNPGKSKATMLDAGGTSAIGTGTTASPYLSFKPMLFGSDTQSLTFTANNAAGVQQPLTITLRNDTGAEGASSTSGASIDSAVGYINAQLQASQNPTLQSIVAVKENVAGVEQINFLSSLSSFGVSVGSSINGNGVNGGTAQTFGSVSNGAANNTAIDSLAGAQAAVTAVTAAVAHLGSAQAAVGKGENQLSYAVNLAQSQITNISAAQSQIRDTNVAQQAANMTKAQVLQQATVAAMAQANQEPQAVLKLLEG
jgi:flagellin